MLNCNGEKPWGKKHREEIWVRSGVEVYVYTRRGRDDGSFFSRAMKVVRCLRWRVIYLRSKLAAAAAICGSSPHACRAPYVGDIAREQTSMIAKHPGSSEHRSLPTPPLFLKRNDDVAKSETCLDMRDQIFRSGGRGSVCEVPM
jgi:hypothetical protein